ncbi:acyl transferase domain-containing protein/acyl carrier protein [Paenibacillus sp. JGP012]|nr:acyl transferase domain-containing protein/acyl carrier protein [Paenibacillus sp. JGP012]
MKESMLNKRGIIAEIKAKRMTPEEGLRQLKQLSHFVTSDLSDNTLHYYKPVLESAHFPNGDGEAQSGVAVLLDEDEECWRRLKDKGRRAVLVKVGQAFSRLGEHMYTVRPDQFQDYESLLKELKLGEAQRLEIVNMWPLHAVHMEDALSRGVFSLMALAQALIAVVGKSEVQWIYAYSSRSRFLPEQEGVGGFFKSMHNEHPYWNTKTVAIGDPANDLESLFDEIGISEPGTVEVVYKSSDRYVRTFAEYEMSGGHASSLWQENGTYLITGGGGALGLSIAEHAVSANRLSVILVGRSPLTEEANARMERMRLTGSNVKYMQVDISRREDLLALIESIKNSGSSLRGVIHAAGVLRDGSLQKMAKSDLEQILAAKVYGAQHLDEALQGEKLDFFLLFSSMISWIGNEGQCGYGYANRYLDSLAERRSRRMREAGEQGTTLSIAWPLWLSGGMQVSETTKHWMESRMGMIPLSTNRGITAMAAAVAAAKLDGTTQFVVLDGKQDNIMTQQRKNALVSQRRQEAAKPVAHKDKSGWKERAEQYLIGILAEELRISSSRMESGDSFDKFGIDSVLVLSLTRRLETDFGTLPKTLLFEYQTVDQVADYFIANHQNTLEQLFADSTAHQADADHHTEAGHLAAAAASEQSFSGSGSSRFIRQEQAVEKERAEQRERKDSVQDQGKIAIIGLSGRYPMADDLQQFWENLKSGSDCITEIPADRWNHAQWFDPDKNKEGSIYTKWGGFLEGVEYFDPLFFQISPKEAELMDPQERLFLETVWHTLEDAGYTRRSIGTKNVGVYVGVMYGQYQLFGVEETYKGNPIAPSSSYASIANRVSYIFDFQGPSLALDTMCSSSLTAIHLACDSLRKGESELAIAGGVNVSIHPSKYLFLSQGKFASTDGRCRSFGEGGDGYVPGEGVGAVLLKPLSRAVADGDHIYGVIRGSALNHGGKTNGYTVPNPLSQGKLIAEALGASKILPETVSYIEAHGTGTSLGDPIEIAGLSKVFGRGGNSSARVAIGSVKSNIGHLESAAGIAGLTKVLLQMKHRQLVPSLHAEKLNANIDFADSPFVVQQSLASWEADGLRTAGVSSFGAGGSNAHIVIEEWNADENPMPRNSNVPQLLLLSARNEERLQAHARKLSDFLRENSEQLALHDVAYTLQAGREHWDERLALTAVTIEEAIFKLEKWIAGILPETGVYNGNRLQDPISISKAKTSADEVEALVQAGDLDRLALFWLYSKESIDWDALYRGQARRIPLPGYPFLRDRYWISEASRLHEKRALQGESRLHPLVARNDSTFTEQKYTTLLSNEEWTLRDHRVERNILLPGAAALEFVLAAGEHALGGKLKSIRQIEWKVPLIFSAEDYEEKSVTAELTMLSEHAARFQLWTEVEAGQRTVHCSGELYAEGQSDSQGQTGTLPLAEIKSRCTSKLDASDYYKYFEQIGLHYGASFRPLIAMHSSNGEALAELRLPEHLEEDAAQYRLHPALLDGLFQSVIGLFDIGQSSHSYLPGKIENLNIEDSILNVRYAYVTEETGSATETETLEERHFNILAVDDSGRVLVRIDRFTVRRRAGLRAETQSPLVLLRPFWLEQAMMSPISSLKELEGDLLVFDKGENVCQALRSRLSAAGTSSAVILVQPGESFAVKGQDHFTVSLHEPEDYRKLFAELKRAGRAPASIVHLWSRSGFVTRDEEMQEALQVSLYSIQALVQSYLLEKIKPSMRLLYVSCTPSSEQPLYDAASGWLKTLGQEHPSFCSRVLTLDRDPEFCIEEWLPELLTADAGCDVIRHQNGARFVRGLTPLSTSGLPDDGSWLGREGAYLITGGGGGLGIIFATEMARSCRGISLVLTGRSALSPRLEEQIEGVKKEGANVLYLQADLSLYSDAQRVVHEIKSRYGVLKGILHSAGVLNDGLIYTRTKSDVEQVLAPKLHGALFLDEAAKDEPLDFFVFFSSLSGEIGNVGQSSYAYANHFLDLFARFRQGEQQAGRRKGKTLSLNWPLWREGGMRLDEAALKQVQLRMPGLQLLSTQNGYEALKKGLQSNEPQLVAVQGELSKMAWLLGQPEKISSPQSSISPAMNQAQEDETRTPLEMYLKELLSKQIKLAPEKISATAAMEEYGVESVAVLNMTTALENVYGPLSKTLFFEYRSIRELGNYLLKEHSERTLLQFGISSLQAKEVRSEERPSKAENKSPGKMAKLAVAAAAEKDAIAIIGLSGRYPMGENLDVLWDNLKAGRDCITEIPQERWNHGLYFNPDKSGKGTAYSKWGGFLEHMDCFDPRLFQISPREAGLIDPQERLFLQTVWHTLEDAGYTRARLAAHKVGVFAGAMYAQYQMVGIDKGMVGREVPASSFASIANRVSYFFDFAGPSIAVDTMCSSSLTAIHLACQSIQNGESEVAIAGGVNLSLHPHKYVLLSQGKFSSTDGRCRAFGDGGDGYVPGEGVGAVLLKPLRKAEADGDRIYGVIRASSINHGGRTNGYSVPNPNSQADLIAQVLQEANLSPEEISYVEAHGTGTALGDPIEITGLTKAFGGGVGNRQACAIGSVKSNIGHLESAAGIAGLTKILLQMKHKQLVPSLHAERLNSFIRFEETPFYVQRELAEWKRPIRTVNGEAKEMPLRAALSSFGAGGSNAHLIIEEWPVKRSAARKGHLGPGSELIVLSARNEERLKKLASNLATELGTSKQESGDGENYNVEQLMKEIGQIAAQVLNVDGNEIGLQDDLKEYGFDQMTYARLLELLNNKWTLHLSEGEIHQYRSIEDLSTYVWEKHGDNGHFSLPTNPPAAARLDKPSLKDIAYTLQNGREAQEERLAVVVSNIDELVKQLTAFANHDGSSGRWLRGTVRRGEERQLVLGDDEDSQELIEKWMLKGRLEKLANLWVSGIELDWSGLPGKSDCSIVSLPLYPFALERYWIDNQGNKEADFKQSHPLIDGLNALRSLGQEGLVYEKTFAGDDRVLRDHLIQGQPTLPGAVQLEMIMAACEKMGAGAVGGLSKVTWLSPIIIREAMLTVRVELLRVNGNIRFQIRSGDKEELMTHTTGEIHFNAGETTRGRIGLDVVRMRCNTNNTREEVYDRFESCGMRYGTYYQTITSLSGNEGESLAELKVPDIAVSEQKQCRLAPVLIDGALQTLAGVIEETKEADPCTLVPYAVQEVTLLGPVSTATYAYVVKTGHHRFDISLCDRAGDVCLHLNEVEVRELRGQPLQRLPLQEQPPQEEKQAERVTISKSRPAFTLEEGGRGTRYQRDYVSGVIRDALSAVLYIDPSELDEQIPYVDFGVDSVHAVEIVNRLNEALQVSLRPTELFNYGSIHQLTDYVLMEFKVEVGRMLSNEQGDSDSQRVSVVEREFNAQREPEPLRTVSIKAAEKKPDKQNEWQAQHLSRKLETPASVKSFARRDIAIIGMSGRFPGADTLEQYWHNLAQGVNSVREIDRWKLDSFYDPDRQKLDKSYSKWMGQLTDIDQFDPLFFSISPKEAAMIDPQQRVFLMESWKAIEDGGYSIADLEHSKCGVFVGCGSGDYMNLMKEHGVSPSAYAFMGNDESIMPARISYFLNLKGPSLAINTACSSSLVALHVACESIWAGTSEIALAGGVSVLNTPRVHILSSRAGMLSADGQCKAFDQRADGFVPSEGVGVVLLKPLEAALADRDHIYGVIKGSGINQDGRSNGITAPSAPSQTELELDVYRKFGIRASDIQYVEAHGTGTKLGDPIEIDALTDAFRQYSDETGYCAIGSVKSNIGHTLTAAGIAGLIKILLSMKHRKLPPSLLVEQENEHIPFSKTPFYVNKSLKSWHTDGGKVRLAAVSSFGFSGTNAHVVVEEAPLRERIAGRRPSCQFAPISAMTEAALFQREQDLLRYLEGEGRETPFEDIMFTLQMGRTHFPVRHGYIVQDHQDLCVKLRERAEGRQSEGMVAGNLNHSGQGKAGRDDEQGFESEQWSLGEDLTPQDEFEELKQIAYRYVNGLAVDWKLLHSGEVRKVPLPTYPFELQTCWFEVKENDREFTGSTFISSVQESMKRNNWKIGTILLKKTLMPDDAIVSGHRVGGQTIFPGTGYLEIAQQALESASELMGYEVCELLFLKPLVVREKPVEMHLRLINLEPLQFQISSFQGVEWIQHAVGEWRRKSSNDVQRGLPRLDIQAIRNRCDLLYTAKELYGKLRVVGLDYGPVFRGVKQIWGSREEALGLLEPEDATVKELSSGRLHPALLDTALHTISGMVQSGQPLLPFSIGRLEVQQPLGRISYAYVTPEGNGRRYQVQITDERGVVCVILHSVLLVAAKQAEVDGMMYEQKWKRAPLSNGWTEREAKEQGAVMIIAPEHDAGLEKALAAEYAGDQVVSVRYGKATRQISASAWEMNPFDAGAMVQIMACHRNVNTLYFLGGMEVREEVYAHDDLDQLEHSQQSGIFTLFRAVKALSQLRKTGKPFTLKVATNYAIPFHEVQPLLPQAASLHGFVKSLAKECPAWSVCGLDLDMKSDAGESYVQAILQEPGNRRGDVTVIRDGQRYRGVLEPIALPSAAVPPFREQGVFLILGGAGGIGMEFGKYLSRTARARVALIGRRPLDAKLEQGLEEIRSLGGEGLYIQADALDVKSMRRAVAKVKGIYGALHGAVHSALVLRDRILENMSETDLRTVLDSKVRGAAVLRTVLEDEPLDFALFFSSANSFSGNAGQGNYAAACTFKDAFAHKWNAEVNYPVSIINWGYWGTVGVVATKAYNERLNAMGVESILPAEGMEAIQRTIAHACKQVMVIKAKRHVLELMGLESGAEPDKGGSDLDKSIELGKTDSVLEKAVEAVWPIMEPHQKQRMIEAFEELTQFGVKLVLDIFGQKKVFRPGGEWKSIDWLKRELGILPRYGRLFEAMLNLLEQAGFLQQSDGNYVVSSKAEDDEQASLSHQRLMEIKETLIGRWPEIEAHIQLLWTAYLQYPNLLTGKVLATDVLFPNGSMELVQNIYRNNEIADHFNRVVVRAVQLYLELRSKESAPRNVRILEIGAGTGGTSAHVLKELVRHSEGIEYVYTDISAGFIRYGRQTFGSVYPFTSFQTLDIEKNIAAQGFEVDAFDVIIATNVLHATRDIGHTLRQCNSLLQQHGWLIINEATKAHAFTTLTFGLLEGWWLYEDEENRLRDAPLLDEHNWIRLCGEQGFGCNHVLGAQGLGQSVVLAEKTESSSETARQFKEIDVQSNQYMLQTAASDEGPELADGDEDRIKTQIQQLIYRNISKSMEVRQEDILNDRPFSAYGIDSISGVEIIRLINEDLGIVLKTTALFDYGSVNELTEHIWQTYGYSLVEEHSASRLDSLDVEPLNMLEQLASGALTVDEVIRGWR